MKKRIVALLLAVCLVVGMVPTAAAAGPELAAAAPKQETIQPQGVTADGLEYDVYSDHIEITGYTGSPTVLVIPAEIEGLPVTSIKSSVFYGCSSLTSINIPSSVTSIGNSTFSHCSSLTSISIPSSVTSIGNSTFSHCSSLTSISIPSSVTTIGNSAFYGCSSLTSISIPSSVTSIGNYTFSHCSSLTSINIPSGVTSIGSSAFGACSSLTSITVDSSNTTYTSRDGILYKKDMTQLIACPGGKLGSVVIPSSVTSIGSSAFDGCSNLTSINIPSGVTSIGYSAFYACSSLTSINIPSGVTNIDDSTFVGCSGLTSINIPDSVTSIGDMAFYDCSSLSEVFLGSGIQQIKGSAFSDCDNLRKVHIANLKQWCQIQYGPIGGGPSAFYSNPIYYADELYLDGVLITDLVIPGEIVNLAEATFTNYDKLERVTFSDGLISIGKYAFLDCNSLKTIEMPDSLLCIYAFAFEDCESLTEIAIPSSVGAIGVRAFADCDNLSRIIFSGDAPAYDYSTIVDGSSNHIFDGVTATAYYPANNSTWTADVMQNYGGNITWVPYDPESGSPMPDPVVDTHDTLDQLTELDYLAFSKLAYRNLDQHIGKTVKEVIGNKWDEFWTDGTTTEFLNSEIYEAIANWTVYKTDSGEDGFYYAAFKAPNVGQAVLSYRGSTNPADMFKGSEDAIGDWIYNDLPMLLVGIIGTQFEDARKAYTDLASDPEIWMITTTGHSLGGSWADAISALYGCDGVSMNAVPILDVVYDKHPQYYGATFTGLSNWNFVDHANVLDVLAGMNEALFSSAPIKPYISHKSMYTGVNIATPHSLWPMVQRSSDGSVRISDEKASSIPNAAMTQERKGSYVSLGSTGNDILNKGMKSQKRQSAYGGNGEDQIYTGYSWDKLIGGAGFDVLDGGYGDDTYFYFKGDGHDYIRDIGGSDALFLYGYTKDDAIAIVEDEEIGLIDVYCNGEPVISIYEDGREYKSFTFDKFEVYVIWENQDYDVYDITSFFKTRKYGSHLLISCPVSVEILDPNGNVVHTLADGEVGSWYTEYGNFYVFEEENGEYGKVLDLVEGYTARIVGAGEGTMDVTYQVPVDGELTEPVSVSNVPVTEELIATVEENEEGDIYLIVDSDGDGETDSEKKLYAECPFEDVTPSDFYYEPVLWAVEKGITKGITDNHFAPDDLTTRGQIVTFLWRAEGCPEPASNDNPFTDVKEEDFCYKAVLWAVENGITKGMTETIFAPNSHCTRAQAVTFLHRYMGKPAYTITGSGFTDVTDPKEFCYDAILWAVENGITGGLGDGTFGVDQTCTRGQIVTFLYRAYN